jgi:BolA family transcriptional regulator, general stress-responsive regulator
MNREERITEQLTAAFHPLQLTVTNSSAGHKGHQGASAESHFDVHIVSESFVGMSRIAKHRAVNAALKNLFDEGLHALSIVAIAPEA